MLAMGIDGFVFLNLLLSEISWFKECELKSHFFKFLTPPPPPRPPQLRYRYIHKNNTVYMVKYYIPLAIQWSRRFVCTLWGTLLCYI